MKNLTKCLLIFIFLYSCGYQPILSNKGSTFTYKNLYLEGDNSLSKLISKNLKSIKNENSRNSLEISSKIIKNIASKDKKGNPDILDMSINVKVKVLNIDNKIEKNFTEKITYNNSSSKFKLKEFEKKQVSNLVQKISQDINLYLQSISDL